jgi:putative thioredoxin
MPIPDAARRHRAGRCAAKLAYGKALASAGEAERALAELLGVEQADREFDDDAGRRTMLSVFDVLPGASELARRYRRALSAAIN